MHKYYVTNVKFLLFFTQGGNYDLYPTFKLCK